MTSTFPAVTAGQIVKVLQKIDFVFVRQSGSSHAVYKRSSDHRRTVVPMHSGTAIKRRTLKSILKDADLTVEQLQVLLRE